MTFYRLPVLSQHPPFLAISQVIYQPNYMCARVIHTSHLRKNVPLCTFYYYYAQ